MDCHRGYIEVLQPTDVDIGLKFFPFAGLCEVVSLFSSAYTSMEQEFLKTGFLTDHIPYDSD